MIMASSNTSYPEPIKYAVTEAAEQVVLTDMNDPREMVSLIKSLEVIYDHHENVNSEHCLVPCCKAAEKAIKIIERIVLEESSNAEQDFNLVISTITVLQNVICFNQPAEFPEELGVRAYSDIPQQTIDADVEEDGLHLDSVGKQLDAETALTDDNKVPEIIDDEIIQAFIGQQKLILPEFDEQILAFEATGDQLNIEALRRLVHTLKGEAGVCGMIDVEQFCHCLEDYMNQPVTALSADVLFIAKDWLNEYIYSLDDTDKTAPAIGDVINNLKQHIQEPAIVFESQDDSVDAQAERTKDIEAFLKPVVINDPELTAEFIAEAEEHFAISDENLMILENEPDNPWAVDAVFRAFHTIKGVTGFLGLLPITQLAHTAENLLDLIRKKEKTFQGTIPDLVFNSLDMLKVMVVSLNEILLSREAFSAPSGITELILALEMEIARDEESMLQKDSVPQPEVSIDQTAVQQRQSAPITNGKLMQATMKIDTGKIDHLLDTIGELVIIESIITGDHKIRDLKSSRITRNMVQLAKITRQLQDMSMSMRMVPIDATFKKMARLVRDLSRKSNKDICLNMQGVETEIDKGMVENLGDPLVHMIRNSVDHGIENSTEERLKAGKSERANITLKAFHRGGTIYVQIIDDGKGLSRDAIIKKAVTNGLITSGDDMSDEEVYSLIFNAGFSTAEKVTEVSGRGVGMDVVKRNIEAMRGKIVTESQPGKGTTFTIILPLTTAIIDGMLIQVGCEKYILPVLSIIESIHPDDSMVTTIAGRGEVVAFRDRMIPVFRLARLFNIPNGIEQVTGGVLIIVEESGKQIALLADQLLGEQQTVVKSISDTVGKIQGVSGATILADGNPGLIIDVSGIIELSNSNRTTINK